jgi:hypothetical protein
MITISGEVLLIILLRDDFLGLVKYWSRFFLLNIASSNDIKITNNLLITVLSTSIALMEASFLTGLLVLETAIFTE